MTNWVLVSGAGTGIGRAVALKLAKVGFNPILLGRSEENLRKVSSLLEKVDHKIVIADIRDTGALRRGLAATGVRSIHAVVANAGLGGENQYGEEDRWDEIVGTNLTGSYYLVHESLPYLRHANEEGDFRQIVFISSILARLGVPGYSAYCASKAGILGLMRSLASELMPDRILVNAICPGWVNTAMARQGIQGFADANNTTYEEAMAQQMAMVPLGKMSDPREIAEFVFFLLSRVQSSITGQTFDINNGALMPC